MRIPCTMHDGDHTEPYPACGNGGALRRVYAYTALGSLGCLAPGTAAARLTLIHHRRQIGSVKPPGERCFGRPFQGMVNLHHHYASRAHVHRDECRLGRSTYARARNCNRHPTPDRMKTAAGRVSIKTIEPGADKLFGRENFNPHLQGYAGRVLSLHQLYHDRNDCTTFR